MSSLPSARFAFPYVRRFAVRSGMVGLSALLLTGCFFGSKDKALTGIDSVAPNPVDVGATVTITGHGFPTDFPPKASIGGKDAKVVSYTNSQITVQVPEGSESGGLTLDFSGVIEQRDLTVNSGQGGASNTGGQPVASLDQFLVPSLPGGLELGKHGTVDVAKLELPKEVNAALKEAGATEVVEGDYSTKSLDANVVVVQVGDPQGAQAVAGAWEAASRATFTDVDKMSGSISNGTQYSGFSVKSYPDDAAVFLVAPQDNLVFRLTLFGPEKSSDEKTAAAVLEGVAAMTQ